MWLASRINSRLPVRLVGNITMSDARRYHPTVEALSHDVEILKVEMRQHNLRINHMIKAVNTFHSEFITFARQASHQLREARLELERTGADTLAGLTGSADIINGQLDAMYRFQGGVIFVALSALALPLVWTITALAVESWRLSKRGAGAGAHDGDVD